MIKLTEKLKTLSIWLDNNLLFILSSFLLIFIPLWPKIPLADLIPGYIVRLRLEDIFVLITFIIYLIWLYRKKISWQLPTWQLIFAYLAIGLMSILTGLFILETIPLFPVHISKSVLHWARYAEYFFLAFLFFSSLRQLKHLKIFLGLILAVTAAISLYGAGQKYLYWPLYSTMNREFSKGIRLYLTPHARVQSTFGGHYDFAAYLVLVLPFSLILFWQAEKKWLKALALLAHLLGLWSLIVSAARTSIIAYFVAVILLFTIYVFCQKISWGKKIWRFFSYQFIYFLFIAFLIVNFGQDTIERFAHSFSSVEIIKNNYYRFKGFQEKVASTLGIDRVKPPANSLAVNLDEYGNNSVLTPSDSRPRPADVYVDVPEIKTALDASTGAIITYETERTWSRNAELYGLSMAIRLDTLWPNALKALMRHPLLGSGYGTINKGEKLNQFTEADSVDNNYLRTLGETGLLSFFVFYGLIAFTIIFAWKNLSRLQGLPLYFNYAFIAAAVGLLINASYIDVFAASKVAFTFWMLYGVFWKTQSLSFLPSPSIKNKKKDQTISKNEKK